MTSAGVVRTVTCMNQSTNQPTQGQDGFGGHSADSTRKLRLRAAKIAAIFLAAVMIQFGIGSNASANLAGPGTRYCDPRTYIEPVGGGGGYCPAQYQTCEEGHCTATGGGDIIFGGGGGGGLWGCSQDRGGPFEHEGYWYRDAGSCSTIKVCHNKRDEYNAVSTSELQAWCGLTRANPTAAGRHLFIRGPLP